MMLRYLELMNKHQFALEMRLNPTPAERILWEALRMKKIDGLRFRRQHVIKDLFIADFYCHKLKFIIEVDGEMHNDELQKEKDAFRQSTLQEMGYEVMRFTNQQVIEELDDVLQTIRAFSTARHP